jgi:homogentisate phytyltransferase/homogentisate geranylgeranyltransferase
MARGLTSHLGAARPAGASVAAAARAFWRFTRPHTVIGTAVSVVGIYVICADALPGVALDGALGNLAWTLLAGFCVNVFIVGLNQLEDIEIDRMNKPFLPLAAGDMTPAAARRIVLVCAVVPVVLGLTQGGVETVAVLAALAVGVAYSSPPLRLKRYPALAALSITAVRSVVVNLGVALHFTRSLGDERWFVPGAVWALTLFLIPFAFAIAILKDVPDAAGDRRYRIRTFTLTLGPERVLRIGLAALTLALAGMALAGPVMLADAAPAFLAISQVAALAWLWRLRAATEPADPASFTRFYMGVWRLFFLEYALVPLACLLG